jgi:hypothetical protein
MKKEKEKKSKEKKRKRKRKERESISLPGPRRGNDERAATAGSPIEAPPGPCCALALLHTMPCPSRGLLVAELLAPSLPSSLLFSCISCCYCFFFFFFFFLAAFVLYLVAFFFFFCSDFFVFFFFFGLASSRVCVLDLQPQLLRSSLAGSLLLHLLSA